MTDESIRRFPLIPTTVEKLEHLLSPVLDGMGLDTAEQVKGGLTNTIIRVSCRNGRKMSVRIFAGGRTPWERERRVLEFAANSLPVPEVLLEDASEFPYPTLVVNWIEGITLNSLRREASTSELLQVARPLGRLLAEVAGIRSRVDCATESREGAPVSSTDALLAVTEQRLLHGRARSRLGDALADATWLRFLREAKRFRSLGSPDRLAHGDFGGRNILVVRNGSAGWGIAGLIDWEDAFNGWALWDVGSLFRYPRRYDEAFQHEFELGYRSADGELPENWQTTARYLDATRQLATLDGECERPIVFSECRKLVALMVQ